MFANHHQALLLSNHNALVFVGPASLTQLKLATWNMAETAPTHQNTKQPHAANRCAHGPTGITDTRHALAVGRNNQGRAQCMRPGV